MAKKDAWETASLAWIHRLREEHYQETKGLPVEIWLKPADPRKVAEAARRLGLKVRPAQPRKRRTLQPKKGW